MPPAKTARLPALILALVLGGCGASPPPPAPPPPAPPPPPPPPPAWEGLVDQVEAGDDQAPGVLAAELAAMVDPAERSAPLSRALEVWDKARTDMRIMPVLRAFPRELAEVLAARLEREPYLIEAVARFLVPGGRPDPLAFAHEPLRLAVAALCMPSGDPEADIETGPLRARALWVASKARLREAIPGIKRAAGLVKDELGLPLPPDSYGAAAALAQQIVREQARPVAPGRSRPPR